MTRRRLLYAAAAVVVLAFVFWFIVIPYPRGLATGDPGMTSVMEQRVREARAAGDSLVIRREWVDLDDISTNVRRAVVVAEDYRFREHEGVDWMSLAEEVQWTGGEDFSWWRPADLRALAGALAYAWENRSELRGRSTITQQLAKNLYFGTDRSFARKAMELVVAKRLERHLEKDRILELYLNAAEWGPGVFGVEAAADTYFGRSAANLGLAQAAALAATLPHPLTSNPSHRPSRMAWRRDLILSRLQPGASMAPVPIPEPVLELVIPDTAMVMPPDTAPAALPDTVGPDTVPVAAPDTLPGVAPDTGLSPPPGGGA
ncbi:MAG: biosynthetic peptidoglycan transglycosylase [Gemmatimonadota bacterium]